MDEPSLLFNFCTFVLYYTSCPGKNYASAAVKNSREGCEDACGPAARGARLRARAVRRAQHRAGRRYHRGSLELVGGGWLVGEGEERGK